MKRFWFFMLFALVSVLIFSGCLTVEKKIYYFKLHRDGSGEGKIIYEDILSQDEDEKDVSLQDFQTLIDEYLEGTAFEEQNKNFKVTEKHLYEKDGKLYGEVKFTFDRPEDAGLIRDENCKCAPYYLFTGSLGEEVIETNGENLEKTRGVPVIRWAPDAREFTFTTKVGDTEGTHPLVELYREWKKDK